MVRNSKKSKGPRKIHKPEQRIDKVQLLSRKIASMAVSQFPREYIMGSKEYSEKSIEKKIRDHTNMLAEVIQDLIEHHQKETVDFISEILIQNNLFCISYKTGSHRDDLVSPGRLKSYMESKLGEWSNQPR